MRYKLRVTRAIALIILSCTLLYFYASEGLAEYIPSYNSIGTHRQQPRDQIQALWRHWSKIFYDQRPRSDRIRLINDASPVGLQQDDFGPREPPKNRVSNPESDIELLRVSHATLLESLQSEKLGGEMYRGTGVVTVGGGEYFGPAIIGLHMLRKTGSTLPVEIFVADSSEYEEKLCEDYFPRFGAQCLVISDFLQASDANATEPFKVTHYQLKSLAMLFSSFAEILYLDSDSIPLVNPSTELFSNEPYKSNGLVIWPDFWVSTESPFFYTIVGLPDFPSNLPKSSSEAGQLLLNKRTHLETLLLAIYYNIYGPDYYYPLLSQGVLGQGDKETFMAAALVVGKPYYRVETRVASLGRHDGKKFRGSGMVQYNPVDDLLHAEKQNGSGNGGKEKLSVVRPAFLHANTPKMNAGHLVDEGDLIADDQKRLRLWGSQEDQEKLFGYDMEKAIWEILLDTGCELRQIIPEWKDRDRLCERLKEHWEGVFEHSGLSNTMYI